MSVEDKNKDIEAGKEERGEHGKPEEGGVSARASAPTVYRAAGRLPEKPEKKREKRPEKPAREKKQEKPPKEEKPEKPPREKKPAEKIRGGAAPPKQNREDKPEKQPPGPGARARNTGAFPAARGRPQRTEGIPAAQVKIGYTAAFAAARQLDLPVGTFGARRARWVRPLALTGDFLYMLGFAAEYHGMQFARGLVNVGAFCAQLLAWLFMWLFGGIAKFLRAIWGEITSPFRRYAKRWRQLRRVRERARRRKNGGEQLPMGPVLGAGARNAAQLVLHMAVVLLPAAAAVVLGVTVYSVVGMRYALAVNIDGRLMGYVENQSTVETAKGLLRDRIRLATDQAIADWQLNPTYTIARAPAYTTHQQLVNEILRTGAESSGDVVQGTGLYLDGELYAVTTEGERLRGYLDSLLEKYSEGLDAGTAISFVRDVQCVPNENDVFFASGVQDCDELIERLSSDTAAAEYAVVSEQETLAEFAQSNGMSADQLRLRNPQLAAEGDDYVFGAPTMLLVRRAQPFLQVKATVREMQVETVPFDTVEIETEERVKGARVVTQEGVNGSREVWYDLVYIDGELEQRNVVQGMGSVLSEPVDEVIAVGTFVFTNENVGDDGGPYMFPVPSSTWSSRGVGGRHYGQDINGEVGADVFACGGGVVIEAGWHWSYGWNVVIQHPDGLTTRYAHNTSLAVQVGDVVNRGDYIAALGSTGNSTGPHVHLEFRDSNNTVLNPLDYIVPPPGYRLN